MNCRYCRRGARFRQNLGPHSPLHYSTVMPVLTPMMACWHGNADIIVSSPALGLGGSTASSW